MTNEADLIFTSLPTHKEVELVVDDILKSGFDDKIIIDVTSSVPKVQ